MKVSALAIGTWQLSGPLSLEGRPDGFTDPGEKHVINLISACRDLGINVIDTAEIYGDGEGEKRVGKAISGKRDKWIVSTKFGMRRGSKGERIRDVHSDSINKSLEKSLKRLKTDYVDLYFYHTRPGEREIDEGREVLERLKQNGKIRHYGISTNNFSAVKALRKFSFPEVAMFSQSLLTQPNKILGFMKKNHLGGLIRGAFAGGRLTGRYFRESPDFSKEDIRSKTMKEVDFTKFALFERFIPEGWSMIGLALRYLLDFDTTHTIVLGGRSVEAYRNAMSVFEMEPVGRDMQKELNKLGKKLEGRKGSRWSHAKNLLLNI